MWHFLAYGIVDRLHTQSISAESWSGVVLTREDVGKSVLWSVNGQFGDLMAVHRVSAKRLKKLTTPVIY